MPLSEIMNLRNFFKPTLKVHFAIEFYPILSKNCNGFSQIIDTLFELLTFDEQAVNINFQIELFAL